MVQFASYLRFASYFSSYKWPYYIAPFCKTFITRKRVTIFKLGLYTVEPPVSDQPKCKD